MPANPVFVERPGSTNFTYGLNLYSSEKQEVKPAIDMPISTFYPATFEGFHLQLYSAYSLSTCTQGHRITSYRG